MNHRGKLLTAINQGSLAARNGYGYYEPVDKDRATSLVLRANRLENEEVVIVDFSNSDRALIYQGVKLINEYGLPYYRARNIHKNNILSLGRRLYIKVRKDTEEWLNKPKEVEIEYEPVSNIYVAELVFIGYKVFQSRITGDPIEEEVKIWLRDERYTIGKDTEGNAGKETIGQAVYGYVLYQPVHTEAMKKPEVMIEGISYGEISIPLTFFSEEEKAYFHRLYIEHLKRSGINV